MEFSGEFTEALKQKAVKDASAVLSAMFKGNPKEIWEYTQLSWRFTRHRFFKIGFKKFKKPESLYIPNFLNWDIQQIHFYSPVMIDVIVRFDQKENYKIRMIAEKKAYKTDPESDFRYNPNSLKIVA